MIRNSLIAFALIVSFGSAHAGDNKERFAEPPFWMMSYDEYKDVTPAQQDYYLKELFPKISKLSTLHGVKAATLLEGADWAATWDSTMEKVYKACDAKENAGLCDDIAEVRGQTLEMAGTQKLENRQAAEEAAAEKIAAMTPKAGG